MSLSARRVVLVGFVWLCALTGGLFSSAVALAASPEKPVTEAVGPVGSNTAVLNGQLNATALAKAGWYFAYNTGGACIGGAATQREEEVEVGKKVSSGVSGLEPGTAYTFCLVAYNEVGEEFGSQETFTTSVSQPVIDSESTPSVGSSTATLEAQVNPEKQETTCLRFEYGETGAYGSSSPCTAGSLGEGFDDQAASASLTKLKPHATYHFRVVVENKSSPTGGTYGLDQTFTTLPLIQGESFSGVSSHSATLNASINVYGAPVTYHFEYGTTGTYGSSTPSESTGAAEGATIVSFSPDTEGLSQGTEYHFRIVAESENGAVEVGLDSVFRTLVASTPGLPDNRVFEMVTPVDKENAEVYVPGAVGITGGEGEVGYQTFRITGAAASGNAVVYEGDPTHNGRHGSAGNGLGSAYLSTRATDGGWKQVSLQYPGRDLGFVGFSSDMSAAVVESYTENPTQAESQLPGEGAQGGEYHGTEYDPYQDFYRHSLGQEDYQPLFTSILNRAPSASGRGVPPYEFGGSYPDNGARKTETLLPLYAGGTADLRQLLFGVNDSVLEGEGPLEKELEDDVKQEIVTQTEHGNPNASEYLYDWSGGKSSLVDVLPDGKVAPDVVFGAPPFYGADPEGNPPDFDRVISADGSRVFWTALEGEQAENSETRSPKALYLRENATQPQSPLNGQNECLVRADACTVEVDGKVGGGGRFWAASSDGSKVFFTASKSGNSLYEYDLDTGVTSDLTPGVEVQGVIGASSDGDYVYYADSADELYMVHENGSEWEAPTPIGKLSPEDGEDIYPFTSLTTFTFQKGGKVGDWVPDIGQRTAEVTPDGRGLVFMSDQDLKAQGFPNGYQTDGQEEVYVYSAAVKSLFCASCSQSGEPGSGGFLPVSWSDSNIPTWISEDGDQVFFNSGSPLVSRDTNDATDVYEWELEGTGSCAQGKGVDGGCIYLLSGGTGNTQSWLLGASASGSDVFMITRADLTPEAQDELYKVFDARVDGVQSVSPPSCTGTGCQGVPGAPPVFATPSSVTYEGIGDFPLPPPKVKAKVKPLTRAQKLADALRVCARKPKAKRSACRSQVRSRYGVQSRKRKSGLKRGRK